MHAVATVLHHEVQRLAGTVQATVKTNRGDATLRFTPADAQIFGRQLTRLAAEPIADPSPATLNHTLAAERGLPLLKPHGGVA